MTASCVGMQRKGLLLQAAQDITVLAELLLDLDSAIEECFVSLVTHSDFPLQIDPAHIDVSGVSARVDDFQGAVHGVRKLLHDYCREVSQVSYLIQQGEQHV